MAFSPAQFNAVKAKVDKGIDDLEVQLAGLRMAIRTQPQVAMMPEFLRDAIEWCAEQIYSAGYHFCVLVKDIAVGVAAPLYFFAYSLEWQDVRGRATNVVGQLKPEAMPAANSWIGQAATAYKANIKPQGDAANKIATIADKTSTALMLSAGAGLAFYVGISLLLAKVIAAVVVAIAAFGSAVFSWAGLALILGEISFTTTTLMTMLGALVTFLGGQAQNLVSLKGEAVDNSFFPGGKWPDPSTGTYNDGSVKDGDADWSLNR
ncbi:hypothetical protein M8C13_22875 [Crossiella sp. SN42]|uniref:hypothetical protein n=1 Tax=Crossiella sp. SN42 TaxID=2944808 RepID=UPI00207D26B3|nr:hypothetical protein [Crossiella sp. SN42]MCO1578602.1 hypothetical protein [Crossiella sp. SN42]